MFFFKKKIFIKITGILIFTIGISIKKLVSIYRLCIQVKKRVYKEGYTFFVYMRFEILAIPIEILELPQVPQKK